MTSQNFGLLWRIADISGGAPCLDSTGISVEFIARRFIGGDSIAELAADYQQKPARIEAALRLVLYARGTNLDEKRARANVDRVVPLLPARKR